MARSFRVFCRHCGYKAYIKRSVREHADLTKLYCVCTNPSCNHSFVQNDLILNLINNLSKDDKNKIFEHLQQKNR
ncbi:ogr/Delta-like zinc finger family protein [Gallibacterium anatis]|uniref:ogr/Delta-like zinc finger family protein n=1 Tax=Gallibacterium anatis TaxID=750 RepID=UPI0009B5FC61|nr:ogr/Delta-like zinc finger family protein [Gallibacterium anatis]